MQLTVYQAKYLSKKENELIVFHSKGTTLITERIGNKLKVYCNDSLINYKFENQILKSYSVANFCEITSTKPLTNLLFFNNKKILIINENAFYTKEIPDVLILVNSPKINLERLLRTWRPKQVVVDGSNYKTYCAIWKATCHKLNIPFHDTNEIGFFKI